VEEINQQEQEDMPEKILLHRRRRGGTLEFLVRWKDKLPEEDSWEPESKLEEFPLLLKTYCSELGAEDVTSLKGGIMSRGVEHQEGRTKKL